jgi:hypothetical protein
MPVWLIRAAPYIAAVAVVLGALSFAYNRGAAHAAVRYDLQIAKMQKAAADDLANAVAIAHDTEVKAAADLAAIADKHHAETLSHEKTIAALRADLRRSAVRLSIPVATCTAAAVGGNPGSVAGAGAEARAELMPATADSLIGIAADGDAAVRQLNAVIDAYNALRARLNKAAGRAE